MIIIGRLLGSSDLTDATAMLGGFFKILLARARTCGSTGCSEGSGSGRGRYVFDVI